MKPVKIQDFKTVEFMRKRREELSDLYNSNPNEFKKQLEKVQKKYKSRFRITQKHTA